MAIWKQSGKWERVSFGPFASAFIVCSGPSLAKIDVSRLAGPGRVVIGVNGSYPIVRPDFWVGMDESKFYPQQIFAEAFPKILRGGYQAHPFLSGLLGDAPACYFADVDDGGGMWRFLADGKFAWYKDSFRTALQFALSLGCRSLRLAGVDLDTREKDYVTGPQIPESDRALNQRLYDQSFEFLKEFVPGAAMRGVTVESCSPDSRINELMPFRPVT